MRVFEAGELSATGSINEVTMADPDRAWAALGAYSWILGAGTSPAFFWKSFDFRKVEMGRLCWAAGRSHCLLRPLRSCADGGPGGADSRRPVGGGCSTGGANPSGAPAARRRCA